MKRREGKKKPTHLTQTVGQRKGKSRSSTVQDEWKIKVGVGEEECKRRADREGKRLKKTGAEKKVSTSQTKEGKGNQSGAPTLKEVRNLLARHGAVSLRSDGVTALLFLLCVTLLLYISSMQCVCVLSYV